MKKFSKRAASTLLATALIVGGGGVAAVQPALADGGPRMTLYRYNYYSSGAQCRNAVSYVAKMFINSGRSDVRYGCFYYGPTSRIAGVVSSAVKASA